MIPDTGSLRKKTMNEGRKLIQGPYRGAELGIAHGAAPFRRPMYVQCKVGRGPSRERPMPVLNSCRNSETVSRPEVAGRCVHALHDTGPAEGDEELLARMGVPDGAPARREAHFIDAHGVIGGAKNARDVDSPHVAFRAAELEGRGRRKPTKRWSRDGLRPHPSLGPGGSTRRLIARATAPRDAGCLPDR